MKICYLSDSAEIHDQRFFQKFAEHEYEVHAISFQQDLKKKIDSFKLEKIKGITFHNLPLPKFHKQNIIGKMISVIRAARFTKKVIKKVKPDVVHGCYAVKYGFFGALSGFHPFLLMAWGSDILIQPKESVISKRIVKFTLKKADMIYCDSNTVKKEILKLNKRFPREKIRVFPQLGINLNLFKPKQSNVRKKLGWGNEKVLIMTRLHQPIYGIEYFFEALLKIKKEIPDIRVILGGDGPLRNKFEDFVGNNGLENNVYFAGWIKNEELPEYFNAADIYVSSSLSDGTSLALLEAMSCGLPVVVTDVPANLEWIKDDHNGFIVPRKDSEILAKKIIKLLEDEDLREKFGKRNLEIAKDKADIDRNFERLEEMYRELLKPKTLK